MNNKAFPSLTVFANFLIDNEERYRRMQDSFKSIEGIKATQWIINIRGEYKKEVESFLKNRIINPVNFSSIESKKGWLKDSLYLTKEVQTDLIFVWVEDHICLQSYAQLNQSIQDIYTMNIDSFIYSWFGKALACRFDLLEPIVESKHIKAWRIDSSNSNLLKRLSGIDPYVINLVTIMKTKFFFKVLNCPRPYLKRWPYKTPFDFEKRLSDKVSNSFLAGLPKEELFACIDDYPGQKNHSLISRGLYPNRISREEMQKSEYPETNIKKLSRILIPNAIRPLIKPLNYLIIRLLYTIGIQKKVTHPPL